MNISNFTKPELDFLRENCNFDDIQLKVFNMRAKHIPQTEIAENLNMSIENVRKISRKINSKIIRVI